MIKIYLAGRYGRREELREYAESLNDFIVDGNPIFEVTSRWLSGKHEDPCARILGAEQDLQDVEKADWLVFFSEGPEVEGRARGGRHVEFGFFLHLSRYRIDNPKKIFVINPPNVSDGYKENIFHHLLPEGVFYKSFEDWVERYVRFV